MGRGQELLDAARKGDGRTVTKILTLITKRSGPFTSLRRGAGVNVQDDNGYTPLHHACMNGHRDIVHLLLSVDASPCVVDKKGATPLHLAAWKGDSHVVSMLLNHSNPPVNIDQKTNDQETALVIAAQFGFNDVVTQLIAKGADVTLRNNKEESALDLAAQYGKLDVVVQLVNARPQLLDPYRFPISRGRSFPTTPLHRASMNGHKEVVAYLIDAGIDPNIRTDNGTALHEGVRYLSASVVRVLLSKGADLKAKDRQGQTVQSLLSTYPEEATRRVKRVIREYENKIKNAYESEEDLPPIPVHDYSPTGYVNTPGMFRVLPTLSTTNNASTNNVDNKHVNKFYLQPKYNSLSLTKRFPNKMKKSQSATICASTNEAAPNREIYSNTQPCNANHEHFDKQIPDNAEILYDNVKIVFPVKDQINEMDTLGSSQSSLKKRPPTPPPKPLIQSKQLSMTYLNELLEKLSSKNNTGVLPNHTDEEKDGPSEIDDSSKPAVDCDFYIDAQQIMQDVIYENMPDDEKAKRQGGSLNSECNYIQMTKKTGSNMGYVEMTGNCTITAESYNKVKHQDESYLNSECNYTEMNKKSFSSMGYVQMTGNCTITEEMYEKLKRKGSTDLNSECNYTEMTKPVSSTGYVEMTGNCKITAGSNEKVKHQDDTNLNSDCNYTEMNKKSFSSKGYVEMTGNCTITEEMYEKLKLKGSTDLNSECNYTEMTKPVSSTGYVEMTGNCKITAESNERVKHQDDPNLNSDCNYTEMNKKSFSSKGYVEMTGNCTITEEMYEKLKRKGSTDLNSECNYTQVNRKSVPNIGYVEMTGNCNLTEEAYAAMDKRTAARRLSEGDTNYHWRGDDDCIFGTNDYLYTYVLKPVVQTDDISPFLKKKLRVGRMPCFCPGKIKPNKETEAHCDDVYVLVNKNKFYDSITDVSADEREPGATSRPTRSILQAEAYAPVDKEFVPFKDSDPSTSRKEPSSHENDVNPLKSSKESKRGSSSKKRISKVFRKKIVQAKHLLTDWKAPETQKIPNINLSLSPSSSSLTNNHQSFVKKIASKCLGLKAKFSSAPNISNSSGLDSEISAKSQNTEQKSNVNTLLIGNSKFFNKILSKKEESGEIVCNDEFDTISLDRLGTLNRDSTVNRSNRSCPGFKNSLPNISENVELSDSESIVITEIDCDIPKQQNPKEAINLRAKFAIFEPRDSTIISNDSPEIVNDSADLVNECYESCGFSDNEVEKTRENNNYIPKPKPRVNVAVHSTDDGVIYENVTLANKTVPPTPAVRNNIPSKIPLDEVQRKALYENISISKNTTESNSASNISRCLDEKETKNITKNPPISRSSTMSSESMEDESNLEDILLSEKSKSFKRGEKLALYPSKSNISKSYSNASNVSEFTEVSAIENVDCSEDLYATMTGTLPHKTNKNPENKKKVLFRHKTFTNIEVDRNSLNLHTTPNWHNDFMKETLANYHIRGTGHCIYKAPTVQEFIYIFNRETLYSDTPPFTKVPNDNRESYFETAICFCKPKIPKHHKSAEDLLELPIGEEEVENRVTIDLNALHSRREMVSTSFRCFCDSGTCTFHTKNRESPNHLVVKFSAVKRSISTPDITLDSSLTTVNRSSSLKYPQEIHYAVTNIEDIVLRNKKIETDNPNSPAYTSMSQPSTISSSTGHYSIKDITDVISLNSHSESAEASPVCALNSVHLPLRKSTSSEYSDRWTLASSNSNTTVQSDTSFKTCYEDPEEDSDDGTLHSDEDSSDTETIKSDVSTSKRPWVHSDSFNFGNNGPQIKNYAILEEDSSCSDGEGSVKFESPSKIESGISVEGSESSSSGCEGDSGVPRVEAVSLGVASLERGAGCGGVRSGSGRRRWDETELTSEGDALSVSSAASSCAPHHLAHHHDYSKVSPTPPKKPPRRNLSVSPTHANSPSSGYSYELRTHARSQDDLDEIQGAKHYLKHGRSVDQYVDGKLSYSEFEENHNSPRVAPVPNPRPSLKQRPQPVAITAMYENVVIKEQNPRRKLRRNNFGPQYENDEATMEDRGRKYSNQDRSSLESLLDDQSMNSPSDCERYYDGPRVNIPLSPTHYEQPPTPDHPPPTPKQAENSIHERIRPLSQEYKRRSMLRDSQTEMEYLLRAMSVASVASGATDRSGNTDNCVEEYVCDVPFAGLFKGSTTTLDGIGLRPMPAERPKTLRKLKSVYDASPTEQTSVNISSLSSNGQGTERNLNGCEDEVRRRSNTTSSTHSGDKSLSILSPFDEQEEWAKISEIMASFGSKLVRESVFVSELEQEFTNRLGLSCSESSLSPSVASNLGLWLSGLGLHDYEPLFLESGYDDVDFVNGILNENDLREMGIEENDRQRILESAKQLPLKITEISNNYNNNNISKNQNESVEEWLRNINLEIYSDTFRKHLYVDMDRVRRIWEVELTAVLEIQKAGHRKRILASVSGEHNGPANHMGDINADLNSLKNNIKQLKDDIKEKLPISENLKPVPPPVVPTLAPPGGETLKRSKKNRPAPQPPRPSDLEIRAPSELLVGVPGALKTQWKHQPFVLVTGAVTYVANYLGSTVVKELRGTESTKKSIQKLKKSTKEPRDSPDIILSISYRGVKFLNTITRELICEHEIRNIHCACQDADDLTHFAYITKDHTTKSHYCHVFRVATMDQATEVILTLGEAFEVAYQMALREQSNRYRVTQSQAKTPTHDPMTTTNKEKPNVNHGRSHSITEIKLNGHQLKIAPMPVSLSNEDFQAVKNSDGTRSPRTLLLKAPIASTEEL